MSANLPPLRALAAFEAAARTGSFTGAAQDLHVTPSAVSHQIRTLEGILGVALFERSHAKAELTEAGHIYLRQITSALTCIGEATTAIKKQNDKAMLKIHSAPSFATKWLMPRLSAFLRTQEGVVARVNATTAPPDFTQSNTDVSICYGRPAFSGVEVEPLAAERVQPLCSPTFLSASPPLRTCQDLPACTLIHSQNTLRWHEWLVRHGAQAGDGWEGLLFDRSHMAIDAAVDGMGMILESDILTEREQALGLLVPPLSGLDVSEMICSYFVVYPIDRELNPISRNFLSWIRHELRDRREMASRIGDTRLP